VDVVAWLPCVQQVLHMQETPTHKCGSGLPATAMGLPAWHTPVMCLCVLGGCWFGLGMQPQ
jgi:hypothetical protein